MKPTRKSSSNSSRQRLTDQQKAELAQRLLASVASDPYRFRVYADDPEGFCRDVLGVTLWAKQLEVLRATIEHRRVAVRSGHGIGKTFMVACLVLWWLYAREGLVVTTAPTWEHVEGVLWREINSIVSKAPVKLPTDHREPLQTELRVQPTWYAVGLSTNQVEAFTGRHHPRLLVVADEAPGVPETIHLAISTLATGAKNCIVMIGNPTTLAGTFYEAFRHPDIWKCFRVSCLEHPNVVSGEEQIPGAVTRVWIEERRVMWGENHPFWAPRVLGEFPRISTKGVIPLDWVERAQDYEKWQVALKEAETANIPRIGGLDVARYGENKCVLTIRRGDAVEEVFSWSHTSLTETAARGIRYITDKKLKILIVDASGIGAGVVDILSAQAAPVYAYNGGHRAFTPSTFTNRRTEMWWHLRERFEKQRLWLPRGLEVLVGDLVVPEYTLTQAGRIKVQSKEDLLEQGIKSPDFADSLTLCFASDLDPLAAPVAPTQPGQDPEKFEPLDPRAPLGQFPYGY